jgi:putative ABC transport system permease protein
VYPHDSGFLNANAGEFLNAFGVQGAHFERLTLEEVKQMGRLLQDVRFGVRSLVKSWRFTMAAVLTLALGIGANTAMFSVVHSVLLRPWGYLDTARLLVVSQRDANGAVNVFSTQDFLDWKQQGGLLKSMGAHIPWEFNLSRPGEPTERIPGGEVSYDLLPTLGVNALLGRLFSPEEDRPGAGHFVILSYPFWKSRLNGNGRIIGQSIALDGTPYTVVGVMPEGFAQGTELLWTPIQLSRNGGIGSSTNFHWLLAFVRLPEGMSLKQARAQVDATAALRRRQDLTGAMGFGVDLRTFNEVFTGNARPALLMLMGCVGFVLLIACANVANLLLARGAARQREMAIRSALGASPYRIIRQLLTESVLLAGVGGVIGIALAFALLRGMFALHPPSLPRIEQTSIDGMVLVYSLAVSVAVGLLFGLVPAIEAARIDLNQSLREQGGSVGQGAGRTRSILVIIETALACMLLIGTGLALKSLWALKNVQLGFVPEHVLTFRIAAPTQLTGSRLSDFYHELAERVRAVPGVESAAVARDFPLSGTDPSMPIETENKTPAPVQGEIVSRYRAVGAEYFHTLLIPLLEGRTFDEQDTATSSPVAIVSESLARRYWPGEGAIGKRIKPRFAGSSWCTVIGVAADVRHWGAAVAVEPTAYYPYTQVPDTIRGLLEANMTIAVRSNLAQNKLLHSIQMAVAGVDSQVPVYQVKTMESMAADSDSLRNFDLSLLGGFSLLALTLAAVGVYAVMAYSVSQRTREIGIRIALGAHPRDVLYLIVHQGARLAIVGSVVGVGAALVLRKIMASILYGLSANDPLVLTLVPCVMVTVIIVASWLPARRATKIDPITALRYE